MPDNARPPRHRKDDDQPSLGMKALMRAVEQLAKERGLVAARVAYKQNAQGQHVVALIFDAFSRQ